MGHSGQERHRSSCEGLQFAQDLSCLLMYLIHVTVSDSVTGHCKPWSVCMDAQADISNHCLHNFATTLIFLQTMLFYFHVS